MARRRKGLTTRIISSQRLDTSVTNATGAVAQVKELWQLAANARARAEMLERWYTTELRPDEMPTMPDKAPSDLKKIRETSTTPFARMGIKQLSQLLRVDDIRLADSGKSAPAWDIWQRNGFDGKQIPLKQAALKAGQSYVLVLPAVGRLDKKETALLRPYSARTATAFFRSAFDEWAECFLIVEPQENSDGSIEDFVTFVDEEYVHYLSCDHDDPTTLTYIQGTPHGMDLCPVQRFGAVDLDGYAEGEIQPYISLLKRLDQDTNDRLVIQRFGAWVVRTIAGMKEPTGTGPEAQAAREALETWLAVGDFLSSDNHETRFGSIPATPMDGHLRARESDVRDYSGASGTPAYRMLGLSDNIGAEAIDAADRSLDRKADEYKVVFGEQYEAMMRLAGYAIRDMTIAQDYTSRVHWTPMVAGSPQAKAQALQIMHTGLGVPQQMLWRNIDDWTPEDTKEALRLQKEEREELQSQALLEAAMSGGTDGPDTADAPRTDAPGAAGSTR